MKKKTAYKVTCTNPNRPEYYKKKGNTWVRISKREFERILLEAHNV